MRKRQKFALAGTLGLSLIGIAQTRLDESSSLSVYAPAFVVLAAHAFGDTENLVLFPAGAPALTLSLPFRIGYAALSPDGKALYAPRLYGAPTSNVDLYKIEFGPTRATPVSGSGRLASIYGIGASQTKIVVSAGYKNSAGFLDEKSCGMYELTLATGEVRKILSNSDCKYESSWSSISLSPDGEQVIAVRRSVLTLVNLQTGAVKSLDEKFYRAAWSPDGRWIAAEEYRGRYRTILFDTSSFSRCRELPESLTVWSPDSRHLVAAGQTFLCGGYRSTWRLIDIESSAVSAIPGTTCKITGGIVGWVNMAAP